MLSLVSCTRGSASRRRRPQRRSGGPTTRRRVTHTQTRSKGTRRWPQRSSRGWLRRTRCLPTRSCALSTTAPGRSPMTVPSRLPTSSRPARRRSSATEEPGLLRQRRSNGAGGMSRTTRSRCGWRRAGRAALARWRSCESTCTRPTGRRSGTAWWDFTARATRRRSRNGSSSRTPLLAGA